MKKLLLATFLFLGLISAKAQFYVDGIDIMVKTDISFLQLIAYGDNIKSKIK